MPNARVQAAAEGLPAPSRRTFLSTAAVAAAASLPGCSLMSPAAASIIKAAPFVPAPALGAALNGPDADLRTVWGFANRLRQDREAKLEIDEDHPDLARLSDLEHEAMDWMARTPAETLAGLSAKAEALRDWLPNDGKGGLHDTADCGERLAWSIADDLARMTGAQS